MKTKSLKTKPLILVVNLFFGCLPMSEFDDVFSAVDRMHAARVNERMSQAEADDFSGLVRPDQQLTHAMHIAQLGQRVRGDKAPTAPMDGVGANYGRNVTLVNSYLGIGNVPTAASAGNLPTQDVLQISGDDSEARDHTITLGTPNMIHQGTAGQVLMPVARILYGSGGVQNKCEVDWSVGGSFTLPGSFIRIQAYLFPFLTATNIWTEFADPAQMTLGAFISKGEARSRKNPLIRSLRDPGGGIPHGGTLILPIPPCATSVRFFWSPATTSSIDVKFETQDAILFYEVTLNNDADVEIPLAGALGNGVLNADGNQENSILLIKNTDGAIDITNFWAIFNIEP